jgi:RIO-like serine/threonine protein kinase
MIKKKVKAKVKKVSKVRKRKNPYLESNAEKILNELDPATKINFEFIGEGKFGETYLFQLNQNKLFQNIVLKPGKYILKIFKEDMETSIDLPSKEEIKNIIDLSKYGLIPKVYVINKNFEIMKFVNGEHLNNIFKIRKVRTIQLLTKIENLIQKWHSLGFYHGDLNPRNILVTTENKVYFIDPDFKGSFKKDLEWIECYNNSFDEIF